tara:strand:+ start:691 stop:1278 length:588 start_codon:yes stop_codon:yes gene_type:complete
MVSQIKVNEIIKQSGSSITIGESGDTITLTGSTVTMPSGATLTNFPNNTPAFMASIVSDQTITDNTWTKVSANTEIIDSDSCYDTSTYRFTPTTAGKYLIHGQVYTVGNISNGYSDGGARVYKNGSGTTPIVETIPEGNGRGWPQIFSTIVDMNGSSDYVEMYGYLNVSSGNAYFGSGASAGEKTMWYGYKLIGV